MKTLTPFILLLGMSAMADAPRNVILFIGDGMSTPQRIVADEFSRKVNGEAMAMNAFPCHATTLTYSLSSLVTDSAAAATAIACGEKTNNGAVGVDGDGKPVASCAEAARDSGRKVGIVTSVTINHATPAGFYAHQDSRSMLYQIGLDLVRSRFDLFLGGGLDNANVKTNGVAEYVGNLYDYAAANGYCVSCGREGFDALSSSPAPDRIWWRSSEKALPYAIDARDEDCPRLPELTRFALDFLDAKSNDGKGFFLMVEGGRIDWAGHANEAAANLRDMLELDSAVKVALEYQKIHPDTLIVVTGDHETGGMSIGFAGTGYAFYMERLASQTCSTERFRDRCRALRDRNAPFEEAAALLSECYGFRFDGKEGDPMTLTEAEVADMKYQYLHGSLDDKARRIMQDRAGVGWTSGSHTGLPALTTSIGPGAERITGLLENTDISKIVKSFWQ